MVALDDLEEMTDVNMTLCVPNTPICEFISSSLLRSDGSVCMQINIQIASIKALV